MERGAAGASRAPGEAAMMMNDPARVLDAGILRRLEFFTFPRPTVANMKIRNDSLKRQMESVFLTATLCRMWSSELGHTKGPRQDLRPSSGGFSVRVFQSGCLQTKEPCTRVRCCSERRRSGVFLPGRRPRAMSRFGRSARSHIRAPRPSTTPRRPPTSRRGWARDLRGAIRRVGKGPSRPSSDDGRDRPRKPRAGPRSRRRPPPRPRPRRRGRTSRR